MEMSLRERIRQNLVSLMSDAGLTQVQLAEKLSISKGTVNNWIKGNNSPDVDMVPRICDALGVPILALYSTNPRELIKENNMSSMGERIKKAREDKGLLQSQLAELIPVKSGGVISNWEKNINKPDADKIVRLCQVLDVSLSYLLNYYGEESPAQQELSNKPISLDESNSLLVAMGYIREGEQLSDADLDFLTHVIGLLDSWFESKRA